MIQKAMAEAWKVVWGFLVLNRHRLDIVIGPAIYQVDYTCPWWQAAAITLADLSQPGVTVTYFRMTHRWQPPTIATENQAWHQLRSRLQRRAGAGVFPAAYDEQIAALHRMAQ